MQKKFEGAMMGKGTLEALQHEVYCLIRDRQELNGVKIFMQTTGDLANELRVDVEEKLGICIIVLPPIPTSFRNNFPVPCSAPTEVCLRIVEDLCTNCSGHNLLGTAEFVHRTLTSRRLRQGDDSWTLLPRAEHPWELRENFPEDSKVEILLTYETEVTVPWNSEELAR
jgi:hypothetical protein